MQKDSKEHLSARQIKQHISFLLYGCEDVIVLRNVEELLQRSIVGKEKYNITLEESNQSKEEFLQHLIEEMLDGANYAQKLKDLL